MLLAMLVLSGLGALARYGLAGLVQRRVGGLRPSGTMAVNLTGASAAGVVMGLASTGSLSADAVLFAGSGFLGGFTTFSTWMVESVYIAEEGGGGGLRTAVWNVAGMLVVGVASVALGAWAGETLTTG